MNYKSAITEVSKEPEKEETEVKTRLEKVIQYGTWPEKPGWIKISYAWEQVPIVPTPPPPSPVEKISLENYVRLQERRSKEYDATHWPGAFREVYPIYPSFTDSERDWRRHGGGGGVGRSARSSSGGLEGELYDIDSDFSGNHPSDIEM